MNTNGKHFRSISKSMQLPSVAQVGGGPDDRCLGDEVSSLEIKLCFITNSFQTLINISRSLPFIKV